MSEEAKLRRLSIPVKRGIALFCPTLKLDLQMHPGRSLLAGLAVYVCVWCVYVCLGVYVPKGEGVGAKCPRWHAET